MAAAALLFSARCVLVPRKETAGLFSRCGTRPFLQVGFPRPWCLFPAFFPRRKMPPGTTGFPTSAEVHRHPNVTDLLNPHPDNKTDKFVLDSRQCPLHAGPTMKKQRRPFSSNRRRNTVPADAEELRPPVQEVIRIPVRSQAFWTSLSPETRAVFSRWFLPQIPALPPRPASESAGGEGSQEEAESVACPGGVLERLY